MICPGTGEAAMRLAWNGPHGALRRSDTVVCPVCHKHLAPRKDGTARRHPVPPRPTPPAVTYPAPVRPRGRVVTQK